MAASEAGRSRTENTDDRSIVVTRLVDAPRELVFKAWTDPDHIVHWWGPTGFTTTIHEMDVRPGGVWRSVMHGPDGTDYPNEIVYDEITEPERIAYTHVSDPRFHTTVTFEDHGGKTTLTLRMVFATPEARDLVEEQFGAIEGANQTLGRLDDFVRRM